jgi:hypothetical protein
MFAKFSCNKIIYDALFNVYDRFQESFRDDTHLTLYSDFVLVTSRAFNDFVYRSNFASAQISNILSLREPWLLPRRLLTAIP